MNNVKGRNNSIDVFRYICAVLVIAIHTAPLKEINATVGYLATDIIPRIGVPFFFIVSGYFYVVKLQKGEKPFKQYLKRLIKIYSIWSCLYYFIDFIMWGHTSLKAYIFNCIISFAYYGSSYHFWFFPAVIFALCLTTLVWKISGTRFFIPLSIVLYIIGVLGCAYYNITCNIPVLGLLYKHPQFTNIRRIILMGCPFFISGYLALIIKRRITRRQGIYFWSMSLIIWLLEIFLVVRLRYQQNIVITFGLYPLVVATLVVLLQNPLAKLHRIAATSRKLANFTYYTHPAIILLIKSISIQDIPNTMVFLLTVTLTFVIGLMICRLNKPSINILID